MDKLYCYENGSCRGESFGSRHTLLVPALLELLEKALDLDPDSNELDELVNSQGPKCTLYSSDKKFGSEDAIHALISGDEFHPSELNARISNIREGCRFSVEQEESTWGFGSSKEEAKMAYAESDSDMDEEDEWALC